MFAPVSSDAVPEMKNIAEPPAKAIKRRASEKIATAIPKKARGSIDGLEPLSVAVDDATDDDKRAPETPRKDNMETGKRTPKNKNILEAGSTGGGEMKAPTPTE